MQKFDYTTMLERHGKDSMAVDAIGTGNAPGAPKPGFDAIPMWVADMNIATAPSIQEEIIERAKHPAFGYFNPSDEYYNAIIGWHRTRKGVTDLTKEYIGYENGVLGGVISTLNVLCSRGDNVLLHSPTYIGFTYVIKNNGYNIVHSPLIHDENGVWRMDFEDMEKKIVDHHIHAAVFCNPHNPCGRVWEPWEIEKAMEIFERHQVWVISDEIWSDLLLNGNKYMPTQSACAYAHDHTAAFYAPSKTFNLAGLVGSYHVIYNEWLRDREAKEASLSPYNEMNVLSMHGLIGAYSETGAEWLDGLLGVLSDNANYACGFITKHFQGVEAAKPQGTYMLFLHCEGWLKAHAKTLAELEKAGTDVGVAWQDGNAFGDPYGIRMNLALPNAKVVEAFDRLDRYVFNA